MGRIGFLIVGSFVDSCLLYRADDDHHGCYMAGYRYLVPGSWYQVPSTRSRYLVPGTPWYLGPGSRSFIGPASSQWHQIYRYTGTRLIICFVYTGKELVETKGMCQHVHTVSVERIRMRRELKLPGTTSH